MAMKAEQIWGERRSKRYTKLLFCICYNESLQMKAEEDLKANIDRAIR